MVSLKLKGRFEGQQRSASSYAFRMQRGDILNVHPALRSMTLRSPTGYHLNRHSLFQNK